MMLVTSKNIGWTLIPAPCSAAPSVSSKKRVAPPAIPRRRSHSGHSRLAQPRDSAFPAVAGCPGCLLEDLLVLRFGDPTAVEDYADRHLGFSSLGGTRHLRYSTSPRCIQRLWLAWGVMERGRVAVSVVRRGRDLVEQRNRADLALCSPCQRLDIPRGRRRRGRWC